MNDMNDEAKQKIDDAADAAKKAADKFVDKSKDVAHGAGKKMGRESNLRMRDAFWGTSMKHSKAVLTILFCTAAVIGYGQTPPPKTKPDNTEVNQRDRNAGEATADQEKSIPGF